MIRRVVVVINILECNRGADICLVVGIFDVTVDLGAIVAPGIITDKKAGKARSVDDVCWFTQM